MHETSDSIKTHEEDFYIIGASQAIMVVLDKNPDEVERDIRMSVKALELEEEYSHAIISNTIPYSWRGVRGLVFQDGQF